MIIILAVLLILVVLAQNPKGGGLSSQFGGSGSTQLMGVKKTGDLLEKLTWGFAVAVLVLCVATNFIRPSESENTGISSPNIENAEQAVPALPSIDATSTEPLEGTESLDGLTGDAPADSSAN